MVTVVFDGNVLRPDAPLDLTPNTRYVVVIQELKEPSIAGDAWDVRPCDGRNVLKHRQIGRANMTVTCMVRPKQRRKALHVSHPLDNLWLFSIKDAFIRRCREIHLSTEASPTV